MVTESPLSRLLAGVLVFAVTGSAASYRPPAGNRSALRGANGAAILPGGRVLQPLGRQLPAGPGTFALAISPSGRTIVTANLGPERSSVTMLESDKKDQWRLHNLFTSRPDQKERGEKEKDFRSLCTGLAFATEQTFWVSEGDSGRVRLLDLNGQPKKTLELNGPGVTNSFSGNLAYDAARSVLYVVDQAHFRVAVFDTQKGVMLASVPTGILPYAICLSPDGRRVYVTNIGMNRYRAIPGGLPFPAFGFPSKEASSGVKAANGAGQMVDVPPLGDPNSLESNSVLFLDVTQPDKPKAEGFVRTGVSLGPDSDGGSAPSGVLATGNAVYVSNAHDDTVDVIDPTLRVVRTRIRLGIPGLEGLRGVLPLGMAFDAANQWLLVAEAGINAVGVIDAKTDREIALLPVGWYPADVAVRDGMVTVANVKGAGTGPSTVYVGLNAEEFAGVFRRGSVSRFPLPAVADLPKHTRLTLSANGFIPSPPPGNTPPPIPVHHVVIIVKENRTFDEVFGDITVADNGVVSGIPDLARFGEKGYADGAKGRFSLQSINVTPNHHALARRFSFSDNFYADSDVSVDGHHWIVGAYPDAWTESSLLLAYAGQKHFVLDDTAPGRLLFAESNSSVHPEEQPQAGSLWQHLERNKIPFRNYGEGFELAGNQEDAGEKPTGARLPTNVPMPDALFRNTSRTYPGFNMNIPDQYRADRLIQDLDQRYAKTGAPLPNLIFIHLPNDHTAPPRPRDGYPYKASYVADNDVALGRVVEYLSHSAWWKDMAILVTEDDAQDGRDHVDAHRTVMLGIGPYFKKNYCSHVNADFSSLQRLVFRLLGAPPLNLFDATASDVSEMLTDQPDFTPYSAEPVDPRLFDPARAKEPDLPTPSIPMDGRR